MTYNEVVQMVGTALLAVGGVGTILCAVPAYFARIIADNLLEKHKANYNTELANFKAKLKRRKSMMQSWLNLLKTHGYLIGQRQLMSLHYQASLFVLNVVVDEN